MGITDALGGLADSGKNLVNEGLSVAEDGIEQGKKALGEGIDAGTNWAGDGLERVGAHEMADSVEDWGDNAASGLGAQVEEQQLGQTDQPKELIHGSSSDIVSSAKHLRDFQGAFERVGQGMRKLDASHWKGEAANAFRDEFAMHPAKWIHAADACEKAAKALDSYADTVKWAQGQARDAIDKYNQGQDASDKARNAADPPDKDPGDAHRNRAQEILNEARSQRNSAAESAERAVRAALAHAPAEPPPLNRATFTVVDGLGAMGTEYNHFFGGVVKGTAGLLNFARGLNPADPYNLTHPAQYQQNVSTTLAGLVSTAAHPERIPTALVESFKKDPSEAIGRLIPELIGTKGAGTSRTAVRLGAREGAESAAMQAARHADPPSRWSDLAQPVRHVNERAIHWDSVDPGRAREFLNEQYPFMRELNNHGQPGYTQNCAYTSLAVERRLEGVEVSAALREEPGLLPYEQFGNGRAPAGFQQMQNYDHLIQDVASRGEDARSVVRIERPDRTAHFFNAINTKHGVVFLDGQSGLLARLEENVTKVQQFAYK
jgi:uncharacterized protein YukE